MMRETDFLASLGAPDAPPPPGLNDGAGRPPGRRFDVYRNNVAVSLAEALETAFPVVRKLLGPGNFRILARAFCAAHPPSSPLMMNYGAELPAFLAHFEKTASIGYLPDVARLEIALRESYHAADHDPMPGADLAVIPPERLMASRLELAPSLRLVRSRWPILSVWRYNTEPAAPKPEMTPQDVLVLRPGFDPRPLPVAPDAADALAALIAGARFEDATAQTDPAALLTFLIAHGAIAGVAS